MASRAVTDLLVAALGDQPLSATSFIHLDRTGQGALVQAAATHGVAPLLYARLTALGDQAPRALLDRLHDVYVHSALRNQVLKEDAAVVFEALRGAGVRAIALKGIHLAFAVYQDPALRPMNDIDLLVAPEKVEHATQVLADLGYAITDALGKNVDYTTMHHVRPVIKRGSVQVEVHHRLDQPSGPFQVDLARLRARARPDQGVPPGAAVLAPEDLLLHLCTHIAFNHAFDVRLLALQDVRQALSRYRGVLDWTAVRATAEADGRAPFVQAALAVTERLWPGSLPAAVLEDWKLEEPAVKVVAMAVEYVVQTPAELPVAVQRMNEARDMVARLGALWDTLFLGPARMREIYRVPEGQAVAWRYLWRPLDLLFRRGVGLLRMAMPASDAGSPLARDRRRVLIERWVRKITSTRHSHP